MDIHQFNFQPMKFYFQYNDPFVEEFIEEDKYHLTIDKDDNNDCFIVIPSNEHHQEMKLKPETMLNQYFTEVFGYIKNKLNLNDRIKVFVSFSCVSEFNDTTTQLFIQQSVNTSVSYFKSFIPRYIAPINAYKHFYQQQIQNGVYILLDINETLFEITLLKVNEKEIEKITSTEPIEFENESSNDLMEDIIDLIEDENEDLADDIRSEMDDSYQPMIKKLEEKIKQMKIDLKTNESVEMDLSD